MSFTCFFIVFSSTSNTSFVTISLSLPFTTIYTISSCSFWIGVSHAFYFYCVLG
jgi:hypothetical protein